MSGSTDSADLYTHELLEALGDAGCPVCSTLETDEQRYLGWFWRMVREDPLLRARFERAGGFCARHAWLFLRTRGAERALGRLYLRLAERDLDLLAGALAEPAGRRRRAARHPLARSAPCPACAALEAALPRKAYFLAQALADPVVRRDYAAAQGLCFAHLDAVVEEALTAGARPIARWLLEDWARRLAELREQLAAGHPSELALRRYVGHPGTP